MLLIAAPAIGMRLGMPGARVVDEGRSSRDGYEMLTEAFGPGAVGPLFVTVPAAQAQDVVDPAAEDPNVVDARIVAEPAASGRTVVRVTPATAVDDRLLPRWWSDSASTIGDEVPEAAVGGPAAQNHDLTEVLTGRAPLAIGLIMVVAFLMLLVVFRSITIASRPS